MEDQKAAYLQMILDPISRMSTMSAIFKGFAATIVAGISAISFSDIQPCILLISFIPVLAFAVLDIYYLRLERKFRFLYEQVRTGKHEVDFSMRLTSDPKKLVAARAGVWECIKSPSIYLFYPMMIAILVIVVILKMKGIV